MDDLVKRAQQKDADAFGELMQAQMQNMYKTARAMLRNDEDAADAISETILICWEKMEQLKKAEFFKTWMTRILINECHDILKQRKRVVPAEEIEEVLETVDEYENIEWLETLKGLDEKYRLVVILYYVNQLKTTEIASVLHMPVSTVRTRLARGREQMMRLYDVKRV
ncbi:MAG: sigma-70 family RNA polymerase sigma factor [Roseburia sp.]|nr:sigma-70 family RNA polymerase sigma factor [Roseburia sp.]MCM1243753.1 sigma-70 family RNA polymerase sigma factor [Roseburia sp.]